MLGLPKTTPSAAVMFCTGAIYPSVRIEEKQLIYLQKVLLKPEWHWTKQTLYATREHETGWGKQIAQIQEAWGVELEWENTSNKSLAAWKKEVRKAAEKMNIVKIREDCHTRSRGEDKLKTKTRDIVSSLGNENYVEK